MSPRDSNNSDGNKGSTEVKKDEDGQKASIYCKKEIISDFNKVCFGAAYGRKTRLTLLKVNTHSGYF